MKLVSFEVTTMLRRIICGHATTISMHNLCRPPSLNAVDNSKLAASSAAPLHAEAIVRTNIASTHNAAITGFAGCASSIN